MRRLLLLICVLSCTAASDRVVRPASVPSTTSAAKPNILFILTDDMAASDLAFMPKLNALVAREGTSYSRFFVTDSLCCPSRASILRGQYVHNHKTLGNQPPAGGFQKFHSIGNENSTIATWLQRAGYRTGLMGKYLNGYPRTVAANYVPPGWDEWDSPSRGGYEEFNYTLNENGKLVEYGRAPEDFLVDVMARKAAAFIADAARAQQPFFLYLATFAPHGPATPAPRHADLFPDAKAPRNDAFDEADVDDKMRFVRALPRLTERQIATIDALHRKRLQSLRSVDDMIESLVGELRRTGQLDRTYIVFTSDNGFHLGAHRMPQGKQTAFETDIHVPLVVRGPGIAAGATRDDLLMEIDLAPTFADWAGAAVPEFVDGRSFARPLSREAVLVEHYAGSTEPFERRPRRRARGIPTYAAIRTATETYVEYENGDRELYDLTRDPLELENTYARAGRGRLDSLARTLAMLRNCRGSSCR